MTSYVALANVTLGANASSVTFSNINQNFRDLVVVFNGTVASGVFGRIQFNGDTGSNYTNVQMYGSGTAATSGTINGDNIAFAELQPTHNNSITQVMDYSTSNKHKTCLTRSNAPSVNVIANVGRWANTAAITSLRLFPSSSTFTAGSTFALYGIAA